jgi:sulfotransferase
MEKTFYFMSGLPRSGSTLLSAILNQNPDIYASPQSDLLDIMYTLNSKITTFECYDSGVLMDGSRNAVKQLGNSYYANIKKPIIIDKHRSWGTAYNMSLAKILNKDVKIIMTVRPILEILASFISLAEKYPLTNWIDSEISNNDIWSKKYRPQDDVRCEWIMRPYGDIDKSLLSLSSYLKYPEKLHIVTYDNIVNNPEITMGGIYNFLGINNFKHSFDNITSIDNPNDNKVYGVPSLHNVRKTLSNVSNNPEELLSDYVINKYRGTLDFLGLNI